MIRAVVLAVVVLSAWTFTTAQRRPGGSNDGYDPLFKKYSKRYFGVAFDWRGFKVQAMAESGLAPDARSGVGARGLMQLMPTTFREIPSSNASTNPSGTSPRSRGPSKADGTARRFNTSPRSRPTSRG